MARKPEERSELEQLAEQIEAAGSHQFRWDLVDPDALRDAAVCVTRAGYSLRIHNVGFGVAGRVTVGGLDYRLASWTVTTPSEATVLLRCLALDDAPAWIERQLQAPKPRRRR